MTAPCQTFQLCATVALADENDADSLASYVGWYGALAPPGQRSVVDTWGRLAIRRGYATTANGGGGTGRATRKERKLKNFTNEAGR